MQRIIKNKSTQIEHFCVVMWGTQPALLNLKSVNLRPIPMLNKNPIFLTVTYLDLWIVYSKTYRVQFMGLNLKSMILLVRNTILSLSFG